MGMSQNLWFSKKMEGWTSISRGYQGFDGTILWLRWFFGDWKHPGCGGREKTHPRKFLSTIPLKFDVISQISHLWNSSITHLPPLGPPPPVFPSGWSLRANRDSPCLGDGAGSNPQPVTAGWLSPTPLKNDGVKVSWDYEIPNYDGKI
jgi:hypothetical protein